MKEQIRKLRDLLGPEGDYSIVRKDGEPLGLGDQMILGEIFASINEELDNENGS